MRRINVSLDTLDPDKFRQATRWGEISQVLEGLAAADSAGLKVKLNAVALKGFNDAEAVSLIEWAHGRGYDMSFIEVMPLGEVERHRFDQFLSLVELREKLEQRFTLAPSTYATGGPARYFDVAEPGGGSASSRRSPTISAKAATVCASPAPARSTCAWAGTTPRTCARRCAAPDSDDLVESAIRAAIMRKPKGHDFLIDRFVSHASTERHMSVTGG